MAPTLHLPLWLLLVNFVPLVTATAQTCVDGTGEDSGGDNCSYYTENPAHCGCCDTSTFQATSCCACQVPGPRDPAYWAAAFDTWPSKATSLVLSGKYAVITIPADCGDRWPNITVLDLSRNQLQGSMPACLGSLKDVHTLDLSYSRGLAGTIPPEIGGMQSLRSLYLQYSNRVNGYIPPEFGQLTNLERFDATVCGFTALPETIGNLEKLQVLKMDRNQLTDLPPGIRNLTRVTDFWVKYNRLTSIPPEIGGMTSLRDLRLSYNQITGTIPGELGNLKNLWYMDLAYNNFGSSVPPELGGCTSLAYLYMSEAGVTGSVPPQMGDLSELTQWFAAGNALSGSLPAELGKLSKMRNLRLMNNSLSGSIPGSMGNMSSLMSLRLEGNMLSGNLPPGLGNLSGLYSLDLYGNRLTGEIPAEFEGMRSLTSVRLEENLFSGFPLAFGKLPNLFSLRMQNNRITGSIPPEAGNLFPRLQNLYLHGNQMTGHIPAELGRLPKLRELILSHNKLSGEIPHQLANLTSLTQLYLDWNSLTGGIPAELIHMPNLQFLYLRENQLSGPLSPELGQFPKLSRLSLSANRFTGPIPKELGNISNLQILHMEGNLLEGSIPADLGNLTRCRELNLVNNRLSGQIPPELGNMSWMNFLYMERNELTGPIPGELGRLTFVEDLGLSFNRLSGSLPAGLADLKMLQRLRLEENQLSGPIPPEFGNFTSLEILFAFSNRLSGQIPGDLGRLPSMRWLHLHNNNLSGSIPPELGYISTLSDLVLRNNTLSGPLPSSLGNLNQLQLLDLQSNHLNGSLPAELGQLSSLGRLFLNSNRFEGPLPSELGSLSSLRFCYLAGNRFTGGIPRTFDGLKALEEFDASHNPDFCNSDADVAEMEMLKVLNLNGCCFADFGGLPETLTDLDMTDNRLRAVPAQWMERELPNLRSILLKGNNISQWNTAMVLPRSAFQEGGALCGVIPSDPRRFPWPILSILDVSHNPIGEGTAIREFLWSLADLLSLSFLRAKNCSIAGDLPFDYATGGFVPYLPNTGDTGCNNFPTVVFGFQSLNQLDLSENRIQAIEREPPDSLVTAELQSNALTSLHSTWWQSDKQLTEVNVRNNPGLQEAVRLAESGSCPQEGVQSGLEADPNGWRGDIGSQFECTGLCPGTRVARFKADSTFAEDVLCRCRHGQGEGQRCRSCPANTFSRTNYSNGRWQRSCQACPAHSTNPGSANSTCFTGCSCEEGYYMSLAGSDGKQIINSGDCLGQAEGKCFKCKPFMTSRPGAIQDTQCFCNSGEGGIENLIQRENQCGCNPGYFVDFVQRRCKRCSGVEECEDFNETLKPPIIKAGFWATPPPERSPDGTYDGFSGHSIWRCASVEVCPRSSGADTGSCEGNRHGRACALCDAGYYGTPGDECRECTRSTEDSRLVLGLIILVLSPLPLLAHAILQADAESRGLMLTLRSFRTSLRQILKFAQVLGVVSLFNVEWPAPVASFFSWFQAISMDVGALTGIACLDSEQQQTMTLELFFRWLLPFGFAAVTCVAALFIIVSFRAADVLCAESLPRCLKYLKRKFTMGGYDLVRVLSFFMHLFYISILKNGLLPLTCSPSPNGKLTLNEWPHIVCWQIGSGNVENFWLVAIIGLVYSVLLITLFPTLLMYAWHEAAYALIHSNYEERGMWGFFFEDFRPTMMRWTLVAIIKDILLNLVIVCFPGLGTAQLLVTAMISTAYGWRVCFDRPYVDMSNTLLEAWSAVAVAAMCFFSAGMGFQSEPEVLDISDQLQEGAEDSVYLQRTYTLIALQALSIAGPCLLLGFQLVIAFPCTRKHVPKSMLPITGERRKGWCNDFSSAMSVEKMGNVLDQLDDAEFVTFRQVIMSSVATVGVVQFDDHKRKGLSRLASKVVRSGSTKSLGNRAGQSGEFESEVEIVYDDDWVAGTEVYDEKGKEVNPDLPRIIVDKPSHSEENNDNENNNNPHKLQL